MKIVGLWAVLLLTIGLPACAENAVVGSGTPASCTTAAYNAAIALVINDNQGGILTFNCGAAPHTINIDTSHGLQNFAVIDGGGRITLDAQDQRRFFVISQDGPGGQTEVTLQNIVLNRGSSAAEPFGGAILVNANTRLDLNNVTIRNSLASVSGGAVATFASVVLNITGSRFVGNLAANGGAIATRARITVADSEFINNNASGGEGGAIQSYEAQLDVFGSRFEGNGARFGGAIFKGGTGLFVERSRLVGNTASDDAGAVYLRSDALSASFYDSYLDDNAAQRDGGAIFAQASLALERSSLSRNSGRAGGAIRVDGGSLHLEGVTLDHNTASLEGGAVSTLVAGAFPQIYFEYVSTFNNTASSGVGGDFSLAFAVPGANAYIGNSTLMGGMASNAGSTLQLAGVVNLEIAGSLLWPRAGSACNVLTPATVISFGGNIGQLGCSLNAGSDAISSTFAGFGLGELADHGGNLRTFLPLPGSAAIDRNSSSCASRDARGRPSPIDGDSNGSPLCDAGAVERQLAELPASLFRDGFDDQ